MDQEKLKIQRAFYDLIKELESLKDTNSAISDFKTSALEISVRLKDYLTSNASAFERMSNLYESYLTNSENHIKTIQQTSEEMLSDRKELTAKFFLLESTNLAIKEHEEAETIRNEEIFKNLIDMKQGLQEIRNGLKETSQRVSNVSENIKSLQNNFDNSERNLKETEEHISERLLSIGIDIKNQRIWINGLGVLNLILAIVIIAILCR